MHFIIMVFVLPKTESKLTNSFGFLETAFCYNQNYSGSLCASQSFSGDFGDNFEPTPLSTCMHNCSRRFEWNLDAKHRARPKEYTRELPGNSKDCQGSDGSNLHIHDVRVPGVGPSHLRGREKGR